MKKEELQTITIFSRNSYILSWFDYLNKCIHTKIS